ncbi:putative NADPH2 dehydrogenase chain OYE2 [Lactarius akahatsu]|uniref:NADPH2 dehydrogenase chain OYE2 n=1 Tax=Lactarius akahatsu TaxID=416441 RepID=A0AAD4LLQ4_9AGAM|nr:putative NADPH2 dehydrogenase chain OYE2 [Lactarius akahatsu]
MSSALFQPLRVGNTDLQHRVVMAPLTRFRANKDHVHGELAKTYYAQRSSVPGTLIISEATFIAPQAAGYANAPGIWSDAQIAGWKKTTDAVHANGSYIFLQLWALGRTADPAILEQEGGFDVVAPSPIPLGGGEHVVPRELTTAEIKEYAQLFSKAASNAIEAGFDGVEIHGANGYILDQFLQTVTNERTDEYGGSVDNRVRFPLEVINAVVESIGAERTAVRISPWSKFQDMGMKDPLPTFSTFIERIRDAHSNFAYIHVVEPRADGVNDDEAITDENRAQSNEVLRKIWGDRPYIAAGGMDGAAATDMVEKHGGLVAFGRHFISNPDLPLRLKEGLSLTQYNRDTFYAKETAAGYIDYPFASNVVSLQA